MSDTSSADRTAPAFLIDSLDLSACGSTEINRALNEYEAKQDGLTLRFDTWPDSVKRDIAREIEQWSAPHPQRAVVLQSSGIFNGVAIVVLHWRQRG